MKSPWKWSSTVEPEREYLVLASSIPPRSRRSTFQLFRGARTVRKQLAITDGVIGFSLLARPLAKQYATLSVWLMTLFIQRATHRDTQSLHAKLDELLHAQSEASNRLTMIDTEDPEDIEKHRRLARAADRKDDDAAVSTW